LDSRNQTLTAAMSELPPGSPRANARLLLAWASGSIPSGKATQPLHAAVLLLRARPLSLNQLEYVLKRGAPVDND
jgi:hypothetical protein